MRDAYVYMMCSYKNGTIYVGVTNDLAARVHEHKTEYNPNSFTAEHRVKRLVWYEHFDSIVDAIAREKRMKKWYRQWKIDLIEKTNPNWTELTLEFDY